MIPVAPSRPLLAGLLITALLGCTSGSENTSGKAKAQVTLLNADGQEVHILAQTETAGPATLLAPGASRVVRLDYTPGNPLGAPFEAVRGGQQLDRTYCYARYTEGVLAPGVLWDGSRLVCQRWGS
ncbi:MAG: hypothetical protein OEW44_01250 [Gemmatimonadota bacterium]|jgi:hypothetical protein|nr:hypothetical protein [Gemmatimonadota bacterium]